MDKSSEIHFADKKIKKAFEDLKNSTSEDKQLYGFISRALKDIQKNVFCGIQIQKNLIPKEYINKYSFIHLPKRTSLLILVNYL